MLGMIDHLDASFGSLRLPDKVDEWERDRIPVSLSALDAHSADTLRNLEILAQSSMLSSAMRAKNYIWAMLDDGSIRIAVEELALTQPEAPHSGYPRRRGYSHPSEEKKLGHPTLLNAGAARIAGELAFDEKPGEEGLRWVINANSGRYCRQDPPKREQIDSVAARFLELGLTVFVDYD